MNTLNFLKKFVKVFKIFFLYLFPHQDPDILLNKNNQTLIHKDSFHINSLSSIDLALARNNTS